MKGYYLVSEFAKHVSVAPETVRRWIREGKLKAKKVRPKGLKEVWGIEKSELKRFAD